MLVFEKKDTVQERGCINPIAFLISRSESRAMAKKGSWSILRNLSFDTRVVNQPLARIWHCEEMWHGKSILS